MSGIKIYFRLLKEGVVFAVSALVVNKLRTILSLLGVTIGIFLIISVFTLVDSLERSVQSSFESLGDDSMFIQKMPMSPEPGDEEYAWWKYMKRPNVTLEETEKLKRRMQTAGAVTFFSGAQKRLEYASNTADNVSVIAVSEGFENFVVVDIAAGRSFSQAELESNRRLCILGSDVAAQLFASGNAVGRSIKIDGYKTTVIGVLQKEGSSIVGNSSDERVYVPVNFGRMLVNFRQSDTQMALKPKENVNFDAMENEAISQMRNLRMLRPGEERNFAVIKSSLLNQLVEGVFDSLSVAGLIIGGFSILVGGFSIANIMFVSVRERTNIIGIQKALGAKKSFILFQFLFESVALCTIGGAIGLLLIFIGSTATTAITGFDLQMTLNNVVMGIGISVSIGLISGVIPASIAARMEPVEAIRSTA
ncbi:MAG: ABC transporter permease [Cryomorphaceae bacterium]|nr:ABC transporter permease [Flavobacteriales bacterium]